MKPLVKKLLAPRRIEYLEVDKSLRVMDVSNNVERFADSPQKVRIGKDVRLGFPELFGVEELLIAVLEGEETTFELKGIARYSDPNFPLYFDIYAIDNEDDETSAKKLMLLFEDVTEKMVMEQTLVQRSNEATLLYNALERSKNYTDKIITSMADALIVTSITGEIKTVNKATEELFGYESNEIISAPISLIIKDDGFLSKVEAQIQKKEENLFQDVEVFCRAKNGEEIAVSFSCAVIPTDPYDDSKELVYIGRDVTDRLKAQQALEFARREAELASQSKSSFLANVSHEIRTPMNAVLGMTGLLLETKLTREQRDFIETIRSSGDALLILINEILDLSKLEAGEMDLEMIDFDLISCIEEVLELLAPLAHGKGLEIVSLISDSIPSQLQGDPMSLRQIITNLAGNAIKFADSGEVTVRAELVAEEPTTAKIRLAVTDTGIGMTLEDQKKLFQPFSQVDASMTRKYGGTGLGLAICKQLVELMEGEIGVESELNKGSEFWLTITLKKQRRSALPGSNPILAGRRLLVVDDNGTSRKAIGDRASFWGMQVDLADGAPSAIATLEGGLSKGQLYDVAIIDMLMPQTDGIALGEEIKNNSALASIPIVIMTSSNTPAETKQAIALKFAAYLPKPVKQSRLLDVLVEVLEGGKEAERNSKTNANLSESTLQVSRVTENSQLKILLAEDNRVNQKVALKQLERLGYQADVAGDGQEVLEQLEKQAYDIILMDCQMPRMDGYAATREIRRRYGGNSSKPEVRRPVVIAMTANAMKEDEDKCLAAGMDDYISKPVRKELLRDILALWGNRLD